MQLKTFLLAIGATSLISCANNPFSSYENITDERFEKIYAGNLQLSMQLESSDDVLYNMEYGSLMRMEQNYESSNIYFNKAQNSIATWVNSWQNSLAGEATNNLTSMIINDNANDYQVKGYEKTFLPTLHALNHIDLNNLDDARIEMQRMYQMEQALKNYNQYIYNQATIEADKHRDDKMENSVYQEILKQYNFKDINSPKVLELKNSYQNAFSHYLAGFVFQALNNQSLSSAGYQNAGQLNPTSKLIQDSIKNQTNKPQKNHTDLLIVEEVGHAPQIQSEEIHLPLPVSLIGGDANCPVVINLFYPKLIKDQINRGVYNYSVDKVIYTPETIVNVDLMATRAIHDNIPHLVERNLSAALRNIVTTQSSCAAGGGVGALLNIGANISGVLLDRADERTWTLLPKQINIDRKILSYGKHEFEIDLNGKIYSQIINLNQPYQVLSFRILGDQVIFNPQISMLKTN